VYLSAAGLLLMLDHFTAKPLQKSEGCHPDISHKHIDGAWDEEGNPHEGISKPVGGGVENQPGDVGPDDAIKGALSFFMSS
jgi:hypothetical protein